MRGFLWLGLGLSLTLGACGDSDDDGSGGPSGGSGGATGGSGGATGGSGGATGGSGGATGGSGGSADSPCPALCNLQAQVDCPAEDPAMCPTNCEQFRSESGECAAQMDAFLSCAAQTSASDWYCEQSGGIELNEGICASELSALSACK